MNEQNTTFWLGHFFKVHWYKIAIVAFLVFLNFKKDFSFTINLNAPPPSEMTMPPAKKPVQDDPPPKREKFSEQTKQQPATPANGQGILDRFDFSSIIGGRDEDLLKELYLVDPAVIESYAHRFGKVARNEQEKFGIPASIILANALLHSRGGQSPAAVKAKNHFSIHCTDDWMGDQWEGDEACYRSYENAWTGLRDRSFFLTTGKFSHLRKLDPKDYKAWAKGLEKEKYYSVDDLASQLVEVIEKWRLYELD